MRSPQPKSQESSIVLVGNLNPKIFQPAWFASQGLIKEIEAEKADIQIIHSDIVIFTLEWLILEVSKERFVARTAQEPYDEPLRDLVVGTFSLLKHTPINQVGINRSMHFLMENEDKWNEAGYRLASKEPWEGILKRSGLLTLTIEESERKDGVVYRSDGKRGCTRVRTEPSRKINPGIFIEVNDHFECQDPTVTLGCEEILDIVNKSWESSYKRSETIIYSLLERLTQ